MTDITLEQRAKAVVFDMLMREGYGDEIARALVDNPDRLHLSGKDAFALVEAALRLSAGADWQPIETAPEGETILLHGWNYGKPEAGWHIMVGSKFRGRIVGRDADDGNIDIADPLTHITHWQPLPAAPRHEPGEG